MLLPCRKPTCTCLSLKTGNSTELHCITTLTVRLLEGIFFPDSLSNATLYNTILDIQVQLINSWYLYFLGIPNIAFHDTVHHPCDVILIVMTEGESQHNFVNNEH